MLRNGEAALSLMLALARIGSVWVPINTQAAATVWPTFWGTPSRASSLRRATCCRKYRRAASSRRRAPLRPRRRAARQRAHQRAMRLSPRGRRPLRHHVHVRHDRPAEGRARLAPHAAPVRRGGRPSSPIRVRRRAMFWEPLFHIGGAQMLVLPLIREVTLAHRRTLLRAWLLGRGRGRPGAATSTSSVASCRSC